MRKIFLIVLFFINYCNVYAHKNKTITEEFGNVSIVFTTSFYYEEINKSLIIGKYAENLAKEMNFKSNITIWFKHDYAKRNESNYEVKQSDENIDYENNEIFITLKDSTYNVTQVLYLLEYSIKNIKSIGKWDANLILGDFNNSSKLVNKILIKKVYRPNSIIEIEQTSKNVNYYFQNNKFHFYRLVGESENVFLSLNNIYQVTSKDENSYVLYKQSCHIAFFI